MAEKEAIEETQRKLRLNLYQFVFYESADDQFTSITIKFTSLTFTISLCIAQRFV